MYYYSTMDSPLGELVLLATHDALVGLYYEGATAETIKSHYRYSDTAEMLDAKHQLQEYFRGQRQGFKLQLDFPNSSPFQSGIYSKLASFTYGDFHTYEEFASSAGCLDSSTEVVKACYFNPLPIIVPDHRLTMSHQAGPYCGGAQRKSLLQSHERAVVAWLPQIYG